MKQDTLTKRLAEGGVLAACTVLLTALVSIPLPSGHGFINLGDAGVLLAAYVLGGPWGALCGGAASALSDVLLGWGVYAPATFVIKGAMALLAGTLFHRFRGKKWIAAAGFPCALLVPVGYFVFEWILYGAAAAWANVPLNAVQCLVGAVVAHALILALGKGKHSIFRKAGVTVTQGTCKVLREPKGGPDVIFLGGEADAQKLLRAGDLLSVRGFTARIVQLESGAVTADDLPQQMRSEAVGGGAPCVYTNDLPADASAGDIAAAGLRRIQR